MKIYRSFHEEVFADAFVRGEIRLSTLEICRRYENDQQGDPEEGTSTYQIDSFSSQPDDPRGSHEANRLDMRVSGKLFFNFKDVARTNVVSDAYLLSFRTDPPGIGHENDFGKYHVEVFAVRELFDALCIASAGKGGYRGGKRGPVTYRSRVHALGELEMVDPVFLKDPIHGSQAEYRFSWRVTEQELPLTFLNVNLAAGHRFSKRI